MNTRYGWGGEIRTHECNSQSAVSYRLTTPQNIRYGKRKTPSRVSGADFSPATLYRKSLCFAIFKLRNRLIVNVRKQCYLARTLNSSCELTLMCGTSSCCAAR